MCAPYRRLIPAMLRFCEASSSPEGRRHVLRYVEFVVEQLGCEDRCVCVWGGGGGGGGCEDRYVAGQ